MTGLLAFPDDATKVQRAQVNRAIDAMCRIVDAATPQLVQIANAEGARLQTTAALLRRAIELLSAARGADEIEGARPMVELGVRSIFEVTCRGRYLASSTEASVEFSAMLRDFVDYEKKIASKIGQPGRPLPPFLEAVFDPTTRRKPQDLWTVCEALDRGDGRDATDSWSARAGYVLFYQWMSNSAAHASLSSIKRFTREEAGVLHLVAVPEPMTTRWLIPVIAAHVGELAKSVLSEFGMSVESLVETAVVLPEKRK